MTDSKIRSFTDLNSWKEGHVLVLMIYRITKNFPREEIFGLTSQMKRAAVSVTSNLAEGFSKISPKEKVQLYTTALASLTELQNQLLIARDISYISKDDFKVMAEQSIVVSKLINGLIKSRRTKPHNP